MDSLKDVDPEGKFGKVYGEDYVILPYLPEGETAYATFASNIHVFSLGLFGNSVESLSLMQKVKDGNDVTLVVDVYTSCYQIEWAIRQWIVLLSRFPWFSSF